MKKYQKYFLGLVWGMVIMQGILNITAKNDQKLLEAFEASDSIPLEGKVIVSGSLGEDKLDQKTKKNLLVSLAEQMGLTKDYNIDTKEEDGVSTMTLKKEGGDGGVWLRISSSENDNYLTTEVAIEDAKEILVLKEQLEKLLEEKGIHTDSSLYVHGDFQKLLNRKEKNAVEEKLIRILEADIVLQYKDEYSDTIYAYSPLLSDYYERNGDKINIQIVLNYNDSGDNTQLYLAFPFYNESY